MDSELHGMDGDGTWDVVIVGAGAGGSAAALVLGRARRRVLLLDGGTPSNLASSGIGGLLGHDGIEPAAFYDITAAELARYPTVERRGVEANDLARGERARWRVGLEDGSAVEAEHVVLAMGMRYRYPELAGIEGRWGASVFHCPFCHGWEHRDEPLTVLAGGPDGPSVVERAQLLRNWSDDVRVVAAPGSLTPDEREVLEAAAIGVVDGEVVALHGDGRRLHHAELADGSVVPTTGMLVEALHAMRSDLVTRAGVEVDTSGHVVVDGFGSTGVDGMWAVGDLTSPMAMVSRVIGAGSTCAAAIVRALVADRHADLAPG